MACTQCGYDVAAGTEVCPRCGTRAAGNTGYTENTTRVTDIPGWTAASGSAGPTWTPASGSAGEATASTGYNFEARRWTVSDKVAGVASLVVLISLFLPWFSGSVSADNSLGLSAQSGSESGTAAHGWLWLVFLIVLLILAYLVVTAGFRVLPFKSPVRHDQLLLGAAGVNLLLVFIGFLLKPSTDGLAGVSIGWSIGAFLALIAALVAVVALTPPGRQRLDSKAPAAVR
jgi:hypothetical protein